MTVNTNNEKYSRIIGMLRDSGGSISGEQIAERLGISRVAVWKLLNRLRDAGYGIESGHNGYRFVHATEKPVPWELKTDAFIEYFDELDSTMLHAARLIDSGCADGTTVVAGRQKSGMRADGGRWTSPDGGLYFTRIRRKAFPARFCGLYPAALSLAVVEVLRGEYSIDAVYSWPCRITVSDRVVCGILTDCRVRNGIAGVSSAGFGLNIGRPEAGLPETATDLDSILGKHLSARELFDALLERIEYREEDFFRLGSQFSGRAEDLAKACLEAGRMKGRRIRADRPDPPYDSGEITDLDLSGALIIKTPDGGESYIYPGESIVYE